MIAITNNLLRLIGQIMVQRVALSLFCTGRGDTIHVTKRAKVTVLRTIRTTVPKRASKCIEGT